MSTVTPTDHLRQELTVEEGAVAFIYDDKVGPVPFKRGDTLHGNLSTGTGLNLSIPFDAVELAFLENHRIDKARAALMQYAWFSSQDPVRQTAVADIAYNIGIVGLLHWPHFLSYLNDKNFAAATDEIVNNHVWVSQVHPVRARRIAQQILTGQWAPDIKVLSIDS